MTVATPGRRGSILGRGAPYIRISTTVSDPLLVSLEADISGLRVRIAGAGGPAGPGGDDTEVIVARLDEYLGVLRSELTSRRPAGSDPR